MLRVASNALIVPPFECAWLSLPDYQLTESFCLQFECKGWFGSVQAAGQDNMRQAEEAGIFHHSYQIISCRSRLS
jgi:hypothetical protein